MVWGRSFTAARQTVETGMRVCSWENFGTLRRVGPNLALIGLELGFEALLQLDQVLRERHAILLVVGIAISL